MAANANQTTLREVRLYNDQNNHLRELIKSRQQLLPHSTAQRKIISKSIRKEIQATTRLYRRAEIDAILQQFRGLKQVSGIKSRKAQELITAMASPTGHEETDRQSIADIFATFYEDLYRRRSPSATQSAGTTTNATTDQPVPPFTPDELKKAIKQLKKGKCKDTVGVVAEMIKEGGPQLHRYLLQLFNDITQPTAIPPSQWKQTTIKVLHKPGDTKEPKNYRPIAIIPLLYKLYAKLLYNRLAPLLNQQQSPDQAGFRHGFCTTDHLYTTTLLHEKSHEWQLGLWIATVDFKKAFDTVSHDKLWESLRMQGISEAYVQKLQQLYHDQSARIKTDRWSRIFPIQRGVPITSLSMRRCVL